jgi:hypothetical protein
MINKKSSIALLLFFLISIFSFSQDANPKVESIEIIRLAAGNQKSKTDFKPDKTDKVTVVMKFYVTTFTDVKAFHINLGKKEDKKARSSLVINVADPTANLPEWVDYDREGNAISISLGDYKEMKTYYASLVVERTDGTRDAAVIAQDN